MKNWRLELVPRQIDDLPSLTMILNSNQSNGISFIWHKALNRVLGEKGNSDHSVRTAFHPESSQKLVPQARQYPLSSNEASFLDVILESL